MRTILLLIAVALLAYCLWEVRHLSGDMKSMQEALVAQGLLTEDESKAKEFTRLVNEATQHSKRAAELIAGGDISAAQKELKKAGDALGQAEDIADETAGGAKSALEDLRKSFSETTQKIQDYLHKDNDG